MKRKKSPKSFSKVILSEDDFLVIAKFLYRTLIEFMLNPLIFIGLADNILTKGK